jgi:hypothetical protein
MGLLDETKITENFWSQGFARHYAWTLRPAFIPTMVSIDPNLFLELLIQVSLAI